MSVSAIIPAFNAAATLSRAIDSVLEQSHPVSEIIVVNDGSVDGTRDVAKRYSREIRLIDLPHGGVSRARNHGIDFSTGEWIAFLDADDQWRPEKLALQMEASRQYPKVAVITTGAEYERNGTIYKATRMGKVGKLARDLLLTNGVNTSTVIVRREALESPRTRFPVDVKFGEDWELWVTLAAANEMLMMPDVLVRTFRMDTNSSAAVDADAFCEAQACAYERLRQVPELETLVGEMLPILRSNIQFSRANYLYDHGLVREARQAIIRELRKRRQMPNLALAIKILVLPRALRNGINRIIARCS